MYAKQNVLNTPCIKNMVVPRWIGTMGESDNATLLIATKPARRVQTREVDSVCDPGRSPEHSWGDSINGWGRGRSLRHFAIFQRKVRDFQRTSPTFNDFSRVATESSQFSTEKSSVQ